MTHLKIGIVEDDLLIAESIQQALRQIGYRPVEPVRNYDDALVMIEKESPDLLILDITIQGELDGIDLAHTVNKNYRIPFIFLTAYSDKVTVNRAKEVKPYAYIVKPFTENDLFSSIEIAFSNFNRINSTGTLSKAASNLSDVIFIKEGNLFYKVEMDSILYIESDNVYLNIYTTKRHYVIRNKLDDFITEFANSCFMKVHRSYAINVKHLETINSLSIKIAGKEIPVSKIYRDELLQMIKSVK